MRIKWVSFVKDILKVVLLPMSLTCEAFMPLRRLLLATGVNKLKGYLTENRHGHSFCAGSFIL